MMRLTTFLAAAIGASAIAVGQAQQPAPQQPPAGAQQQQQPPDPTPPDNLPRPSTTDPRANLKPGGPGVKAAEAAWNMELVSNLPKPQGFFDPERPLGTRPPEAPEPAPGAPRTPPRSEEHTSELQSLAYLVC